MGFSSVAFGAKPDHEPRRRACLAFACLVCHPLLCGESRYYLRFDGPRAVKTVWPTPSRPPSISFARNCTRHQHGSMRTELHLMASSCIQRERTRVDHHEQFYTDGGQFYTDGGHDPA